MEISIFWYCCPFFSTLDRFSIKSKFLLYLFCGYIQAVLVFVLRDTMHGSRFSSGRRSDHVCAEMFCSLLVPVPVAKPCLCSKVVRVLFLKGLNSFFQHSQVKNLIILIYVNKFKIAKIAAPSIVVRF